MSYIIDYSVLQSQNKSKKDIFELNQIKNHLKFQIDGLNEKYRFNEKVLFSLQITQMEGAEPSSSLDYAIIKVYYETENEEKFLIKKITGSIPTLKPIKLRFKFGPSFPVSPKFRFTIAVLHKNKYIGLGNSSYSTILNSPSHVPVKVIKIALNPPLLFSNATLIPILTLDTSNFIGNQEIFAHIKLIGETQEDIIKESKITIKFTSQLKTKQFNLPLPIKIEGFPESLKTARLLISLSSDQVTESGESIREEFFNKKFPLKISRSIDGIYASFVGFKRDFLELGQAERVFDIINNSSIIALKGKVDVSLFSAISGNLSVINRKVNIHPEDHLDIVELRQPPFSFGSDYLWVMAHNVLNCKGAGTIDFLGISEKPILVKKGNNHPLIVRIRSNNPDKFVLPGTYLACELFVKFDYPLIPEKFIITLYQNYENISRVKLCSFKIKDSRFGKAFNFHWKLSKIPGMYFMDAEIQMDNRIFSQEIPDLIELSSPSYYVMESEKGTK